MPGGTITLHVSGATPGQTLLGFVLNGSVLTPASQAHNGDPIVVPADGHVQWLFEISPSAPVGSYQAGVVVQSTGESVGVTPPLVVSNTPPPSSGPDITQYVVWGIVGLAGVLVLSRVLKPKS